MTWDIFDNLFTVSSLCVDLDNFLLENYIQIEIYLNYSEL